MTFGSTFGRVFSPTFQPKSQAAAGGWAGTGTWWLSGSISAANCIAAYEAKNAPDYESSKINLANPGTYNITVASGADPSWAAVDGWTFDGAKTWLSTGVVYENDQTWSLLIRYSNHATAQRALALARTTSNNVEFGFYLSATGNAYFYNGKSVQHATGINAAGVIGTAGNKPYFDGSALAETIPSGTGTSTVGLPLGAMDAAGTRSLWYNGKIQAVAIYDAALSVAQMAAVSTAMAAL